MRDPTIKGEYTCAKWYRMDPKYDEQYLRKHAFVAGIGQSCTCEGCSGNKALSFCHNDIADPGSTYMDINTAKSQGKVGKMRLAINDDMVDPDYCEKNDFCRKHTCLEVRCLGRVFVFFPGKVEAGVFTNSRQLVVLMPSAEPPPSRWGLIYLCFHFSQCYLFLLNFYVKDCLRCSLFGMLRRETLGKK